MLFAVEALDPTLRFLFYAGALVCFAVAAFGYSWGRVSMVALGLALFTFPTFWDALVNV